MLEKAGLLHRPCRHPHPGALPPKCEVRSHLKFRLRRLPDGELLEFWTRRCELTFSLELLAHGMLL
ncbi:BQ5605_C001g00031 [Microbotryum silenes-dioicae]|uniref:BQ5605_C001g00025 protein n=1 Tax=Microbotryum silenes-dioicae TaxID=796604 RepID=A0A2X0P4P6_9BASI|nr:BQ5605_C001g00025 [Microbotryum silenes-dioicae]SGY43500.1 BQ5605_C001g00028 [Microbotryum silenes-dioicae]SGY43536.1 BQ5605_C001g00031 [Microbotryum silenes-dioicae]